MKPEVVCLVAIRDGCVINCDIQNPDSDDPWFLMCFGDGFIITNSLKSYYLANADDDDKTNYRRAVGSLLLAQLVMANLIDGARFKIGLELIPDAESRGLIAKAVNKFVDAE